MGLRLAVAMAIHPDEMVAESPRVRFVKWRNLIGDEELMRRINCKIHTVVSLSYARRRTPGLKTSLLIEAESAKDRKRAKALGFELPILATEIAQGWG